MEIENFRGSEHLTTTCDACFGVELIMFVLLSEQKVAVNWEGGRYGWSLLMSLQKGFPHGIEHYKVDQLLRASFFTEFIKFKLVTMWSQKQYHFCAIISVKFPSCPGQSSVMCRDICKGILQCVYLYFFLRFFSLKRVFPSRYENLCKRMEDKYTSWMKMFFILC